MFFFWRADVKTQKCRYRSQRAEAEAAEGPRKSWFCKRLVFLGVTTDFLRLTYQRTNTHHCKLLIVR
jgi:hypothetical protein